MELRSAPWFEKINVKGLSEESRRAILRRFKDKLGFSKAIEVLDISKGSMHNYLHGKREIPDEVILKALQHIDEKEFSEIVGSFERLKVAGILKDDGSIDYSAILQALALATSDEYLKQAILRFAVEHFREDLKKMLGILPANIVLTWENGFENFLKEYKKRRKVRTQETLEYYKKLFKEYLEGKSVLMGMSKKEIERKSEEIFKFAELEKFRNMKLKNFSSGMYARLAFATAVATEPEILLVDEVLAVGDTSFQKSALRR